MSSILSQLGALGGNPYATAVGQLIEQATDGSLTSENWELNLEICDLVNKSEDNAHDAIKAIKKRLLQNVGRNYTVVLHTLTVLETCVKNCNRRFHILVCNKDFVQELIKLIGPKNDPPTAVQEKVLSLIQSWADAFAGIPELSGVCQMASELRAKGVEFPATDFDKMAPIITPQRTVTEPCLEAIPATPSSIQAPTQTSPSRRGPIPAAQLGPQQITSLTPEQLAKLKSELDIVQINMSVMSDILNDVTSISNPDTPKPGTTTVKPPGPTQDDYQLLNELHTTLLEMQTRLVDLISQSSNDELTNELLLVNDGLNNVLLRYNRYERTRESGQRAPSKIIGDALHTAGASPRKVNVETPEKSLIDFGDVADSNMASIEKKLSALDVASLGANSRLSKIAGLPAQSGAKSDEFDMFAQSRNVTYESSKRGGSTYKDNLDPDQVSGGLSSLTKSRTHGHNPFVDTHLKQTEKEIDEISAWLEEKPGSSNDTEGLTSSEFEKFLAERAAAAEALPSATNTNSQNDARKKKQKDTDAGLFGV